MTCIYRCVSYIDGYINIYAYMWYLYCKYMCVYIHDTIYIYLYKTIYIFSTGFAVSAPPLDACHLLELFEISISTSLKVVTGRKFISFVGVHKKCFTNKYDKIRPLTPDPSTFRQDSPCTSWIDGQRSFVGSLSQTFFISMYWYFCKTWGWKLPMFLNSVDHLGDQPFILDILTYLNSSKTAEIQPNPP